MLLLNASYLLCQAKPPSNLPLETNWFPDSSAAVLAYHSQSSVLYSSHACFRDLPLLRDAATVNASFLALPTEANGFPANATLQQFLASNFNLVPGSDFEAVTPDDFSSDPDGFLPNVTDTNIRSWALSVNDLWQTLCRQVSSYCSFNDHMVAHYKDRINPWQLQRFHQDFAPSDLGH